MSRLHKGLEEILSQYWGYKAFRPYQKQIIEQVLKEQDTIAVIATGGGKSICYQLPSLLLEGLTIVISPLISLMEDQVQILKKKNIKAEALFSGQGHRKSQLIIDQCIAGKINILYLAPERLQSSYFQQVLPNLPLRFLAVDESHCISQWGHDFRPSYLELSVVREYFPNVPILALTGTATDLVIEEIGQLLKLKNPRLFRSSVERPNLKYSCLEVSNKTFHLKRILREYEGSFIIYTRSRRSTEILSQELQELKIKVAPYHAGMSQEARSKNQQSWIKNQIRGIVATTAFGMGIDKPDVRLIIHFDIPGSLEEYVQETGRAGRDGLLSDCILITNTKDQHFSKERLTLAFPTTHFIKKIYRHLAHYTQNAAGSDQDMRFAFDLDQFCKQYQLKVVPTKSSLDWLAKLGYIGYSQNYASKSRVWVKADKSVWTDLQNLPETMTRVFQALLRYYEGILITFTHIDEQVLSSKLGISFNEVNGTLANLAKYDLIEFEPKGDSGLIWFQEERIRSEDLLLDEPLYEKIKANKLFQFQSMQGYVQESSCRQQYMAAYFNEQINRCGRCDLCLQRGTDEKTIRRLIIEKSIVPISLDSLVESFERQVRDQVLKEIMDLEQENILLVGDDRMVVRRK